MPCYFTRFFSLKRWSSPRSRFRWLFYSGELPLHRAQWVPRRDPELRGLHPGRP
jgi:hypothetical protein